MSRKAIVGPIRELCKRSGDSVSILVSEVSYESPVCVIEVKGRWTNWQTRQFRGPTLGEVLFGAVTSRRNILDALEGSES